jgi:hypothetical protein
MYILYWTLIYHPRLKEETITAMFFVMCTDNNCRSHFTILLKIKQVCYKLLVGKQYKLLLNMLNFCVYKVFLEDILTCSKKIYNSLRTGY